MFEKLYLLKEEIKAKYCLSEHAFDLIIAACEISKESNEKKESKENEAFMAE